jgi:3-dehydroquinate synthase
VKAVRVRVGERAYPVLIGEGGLARAGRLVRERLDRDRVAVIVDAGAARHHGRALRASLREAGVVPLMWVEIPPGERSKSLTRARFLYDRLVEARADRWTPVLALGGGVVGDLAGFVASTFLRGLPLVHIPTTVVSQVDSSVGGKTAVNFAGAKNLVGSFHQPDLVIADPATLATLSTRDLRAGLVEAVKIGVTLRPDLLERMERDAELLLARDGAALGEVVVACVEAKGEVVGRDEREQDVRAVLNYGHTLGHALEVTSRGRLRHGEAVAVGMNGAAWVGETLGVSLPTVRERQNDLLLRLGLKLSAPGADKGEAARKLKLDKKVRDSHPRFVLTLQIGGASVWPRIPKSLLRDALARITR